MKRITRYLLASVLTLSLALLMSCSSSDVADNNSNTPNSDGTLTGVFLDSPVAGLSYATSSGLSGLTNAAGEFNYLPGDTITFSLGEGALALGTVAAAASITPFDVAGFELEGGDLSLSDLAVDIALAEANDSATKFEQGVNMLILLQSLDRNNNPADGIEITQAVLTFFSTAVLTLLFDMDTRDFIAEFLVLFLSLVSQGILDRATDDRPVDRDDALIHFLTNN